MPPDSVTVLANAFIIRQMDLSNPSDFLASANVSRVAAELGFWEPPAGSGADGAEAVPWDADGAFDFTAAFGGSAFPAAADPADPSGRKRLITRFYSGRRIWRVFDLLAPSLRLDPDWGYLQEAPTYPQAVVPEQPVSVRRFFGLLRDHYEGTPFDLTAGLAAGPYGSVRRSSRARAAATARPAADRRRCAALRPPIPPCAPAPPPHRRSQTDGAPALASARSQAAGSAPSRCTAASSPLLRRCTRARGRAHAQPLSPRRAHSKRT